MKLGHRLHQTVVYSLYLKLLIPKLLANRGQVGTRTKIHWGFIQKCLVYLQIRHKCVFECVPCFDVKREQRLSSIVIRNYNRVNFMQISVRFNAMRPLPQKKWRDETFFQNGCKSFTFGNSSCTWKRQEFWWVKNIASPRCCLYSVIDKVYDKVYDKGRDIGLQWHNSVLVYLLLLSLHAVNVSIWDKCTHTTGKKWQVKNIAGPRCLVVKG